MDSLKLVFPIPSFSRPLSYVTVVIDLDAPENREPVTAHEDSEVIEVTLVPCNKFRQALDEKYAQKWTLDARLYT